MKVKTSFRTCYPQLINKMWIEENGMWIVNTQFPPQNVGNENLFFQYMGRMKIRERIMH